MCSNVYWSSRSFTSATAERQIYVYKYTHIYLHKLICTVHQNHQISNHTIIKTCTLDHYFLENAYRVQKSGNSSYRGYNTQDFHSTIFFFFLCTSTILNYKNRNSKNKGLLTYGQTSPVYKSISCFVKQSYPSVLFIFITHKERKNVFII